MAPVICKNELVSSFVVPNHTTQTDAKNKLIEDHLSLIPMSRVVVWLDDDFLFRTNSALELNLRSIAAITVGRHN